MSLCTSNVMVMFCVVLACHKFVAQLINPTSKNAWFSVTLLELGSQICPTHKFVIQALKLV